MKTYLLLMITFFSFSSFATDNAYKFNHFETADNFNFSKVLAQKEWTILVFNNGYCPIPDSKMQCFPFEMKLSYYAPNIKARNSNLQIVNIDMERTYISNRYFVSSAPTVIFLLNGVERARFEKTRHPNLLIQQVLDEVFRIPSTY
jgi:hypothetical protein